MTAAILAGGQSSRFGRDKALAQFGKITLIQHIYRSLKPLFDEVLIISGEHENYGCEGARVLPDMIKKAGPLGGIHAALKASSEDWVFITACDMPYISGKLITRMRNEIKSPEPSAVVAGRKGFIEPFHAFYSTKLTGEIENSLNGSSCGLFSFLKKISPLIIDTEEEQVFFNINSPEDLRKATFQIK